MNYPHISWNGHSMRFQCYYMTFFVSYSCFNLFSFVYLLIYSWLCIQVYWFKYELCCYFLCICIYFTLSLLQNYKNDFGGTLFLNMQGPLQVLVFLHYTCLEKYGYLIARVMWQSYVLSSYRYLLLL